MLFSLFKHYLGLYISDTALKVSQALCCFTNICHGVENSFPRLWGMGISDAILLHLSFMVLKTISPASGVCASLLFFRKKKPV